MDVVWLSRLQFAVTVFFHFIFVPLTLGLSLIIAVMETCYVRSGNEVYKRMAKFWGKLFLINFALGVVTGITLEFQFGTNWSRYSKYVGDVFGSLLAIEATVAFFLESTFIAVWTFGWNKVSRRAHAAAIWIVAIAGNISALWIILANGWMQNPVGYVMKNGRAELADFFEVIANPYAWGQFFHTITASWMLAGFFVMGICAWHLLRKNEVDFFKRSFRFGAHFALIFAVITAAFGHLEGQSVARHQPAKLAAMESFWNTEAHAPMHLFVVPDPQNARNIVEFGAIPSMLSILAYNDPSAPVQGLLAFPEENRPPVTETFISFRIMVGLGGIFILLALIAWIWRNRIENHRRILNILVWLIPFPYIAIMAGWAVAEIGRQPWIVYNLMRTADAVSPVPSGSVLTSLIAFGVIYFILGALDIWLIGRFARKGPATV